jgi:hypothetical protein
LVHVNPGALIPDIGHLEEILIETHFPNRFLEHGFMGSRRAGGNENPVQLMFLDGFLDLLLGILGTGVKVFVDVDNPFKRLGILFHLGNLDDPSDIDPAVADKDTDPWLLTLDIELGGIFFLLCQCPTDVGQEGGRTRNGATRLGHRLGNILRALEGAADIDARFAGLKR